MSFDPACSFPAWLVAPLVIACTATRADPWPDEGPAPTPYTAEQIRDGHPDGTRVIYRIEQAGSPTVHRFVRFVDGDDTSVAIEAWNETPSGDPAGEPTSQRSRWEELRDHASFDAAATTRTEVECEVETGRYDCWLYEVRAEEAGRRTVSRFYFAKSKPGPPVLLEVETDGTRVYRMEMIEFRRGG